MKYLPKYLLYFTLLFASKNGLTQNIGNYVTNGSFEEHYPCNGLNMINLCKGWRSIDSSLYSGVFYMHTCFGNVPSDQSTFQYPKTGNGFGVANFFCLQPECLNWLTRGFFRNRLKKNLVSNQKYCVKFYVNLRDVSSIAIDKVGVYFCDNSIDTITKINIPLPFFTPQVTNASGNIISDTVNWVLVTGTFVAIGSESNLLLGNFYSDSNTNTVTIKTYTPLNRFCDFNIDDVSCIPLDLPAYAGPDKSCRIGDSVYVGRESDFAIDPGCVWYQLPNMSVPIATASGIWVKPTPTSVGSTTYVVRQVLDCSALKWDTVVVYTDLVGLQKNVLDYARTDLGIYPQPADEMLNVEFSSLNQSARASTGSATAVAELIEMTTTNYKYSIVNSLGQIIREEEITFKNGKTNISTKELENGVYVLSIKTNNLITVSKRFVITR